VNFGCLTKDVVAGRYILVVDRTNSGSQRRMGEYCLKTSFHLFDSNNTLDSFSILLDILFYPYECFYFTHLGE